MKPDLPPYRLTGNTELMHCYKAMIRNKFLSMRKLFVNILLLAAIHAPAQLSVNILAPAGGMMDKQQLWNMVLTNTEPTPLTVQVQVVFAEINSGQPVFTASIPSMTINPGITQLTPANTGMIQFNAVNPGYQVDPGPEGLLPAGTFNACYNFVIDKYNKVVRECRTIIIPPLGPLLLTQPANEAELENLYPLFSWLPPMPAKLLGNPRYSFRLVEVMEQQSPADAIRDNMPVLAIDHTDALNYAYNNNGQSLTPGRQYAWQVVALNNLVPVTKSEIWSFAIKKEAVLAYLPKPGPVFIKLKKQGQQEGSAVYWGRLRFDFLNESADQHWSMAIEDLSASQHQSFSLPMDSIQLRPGQNLVDYDATADKRFINGHQYLLKLMNRQNETWMLRFEYRKPE